jgi:F0F1-type ATP synthase assembly protein I
MAIGVVVGAVLGVAFDAIPLGSAIGLGLGGTLGVLLSLRQRQNRNE